VVSYFPLLALRIPTATNAPRPVVFASRRGGAREPASPSSVLLWRAEYTLALKELSVISQSQIYEKDAIYQHQLNEDIILSSTYTTPLNQFGNCLL
jgi:hypothetical protein